DERASLVPDPAQRLGHLARHRSIRDQIVEAKFRADGLDARWTVWHTSCLSHQRTMKFLLPAVFGLVLLTGASGPGPLKDSMGNLFTNRDEMARMRGEVADLRHGRGSAAPAWVNQYAGALCAADSAYILERTDAALGVTEQDIDAQFQRMHAIGLDCKLCR